MLVPCRVYKLGFGCCFTSFHRLVSSRKRGLMVWLISAKYDNSPILVNHRMYPKVPYTYTCILYIYIIIPTICNFIFSAVWSGVGLAKSTPQNVSFDLRSSSSWWLNQPIGRKKEASNQHVRECVWNFFRSNKQPKGIPQIG